MLNPYEGRVIIFIFPRYEKTKLLQYTVSNSQGIVIVTISISESDTLGTTLVKLSIVQVILNFLHLYSNTNKLLM